MDSQKNTDRINCFRCKSEDIRINNFSPDDKPYVIRTEYQCKECLNFWYEDD